MRWRALEAGAFAVVLDEVVAVGAPGDLGDGRSCFSDILAACRFGERMFKDTFFSGKKNTCFHSRTTRVFGRRSQYMTGRSCSVPDAC